MYSVYFGIDFGTTRSCITAIYDKTITTLNLTSKYNQKTIDSVVSYYSDNTHLVGVNDPNAHHIVLYPKNNLNDNNNFIATIHILSYMVDKAIEQCNNVQRPIKAILTVPTRFNELQRNSIKKAASIAGIDCIQLLHEPTAAAISYGITEQNNGSVIVYDLGGGTLDITMIDIDNDLFHVIDTEGDISVGANEVNNIIYDNIILNNSIPLLAINDEIEQKKLLLSSDSSLLWVNLCKRYNNTVINTSLSKEQLTMFLSDWYKKCNDPLIKILNKAKDAHFEPLMILLVGGGTKTFGLTDCLKKSAGTIPVYEHPNPDCLISQGAAIKAFGHNPTVSTAITLIDTVSLTLGIDTNGTFTPLITRGNVLPCSSLKKFTTTEDNQTTIEIAIYQGERAEIRHNELIDTLILQLNTPKAKGLPVIDVTFSIDNSGMLTVTAQESSDGAENSITIDKYSFQKKTSEIDSIIEEYHKNKHLDNLKQQVIETSIRIREMIDHILLNISSEHTKLDQSFVQLHTHRLTHISIPDNINELNALKVFLEKEYEFFLVQKEMFQSHNTDVDADLSFNDDEYDEEVLIQELSACTLTDSDQCIMSGLLSCTKEIRLRGLKNLHARYITIDIDERQQLIDELINNIEQFGLTSHTKSILLTYLKQTNDDIDDINAFCEKIINEDI